MRAVYEVWCQAHIDSCEALRVEPAPRYRRTTKREADAMLLRARKECQAGRRVRHFIVRKEEVQP